VAVARSAAGVADPGRWWCGRVRSGADHAVTRSGRNPGVKPVMRKACSAPEVGWIPAAAARSRYVSAAKPPERVLPNGVGHSRTRLRAHRNSPRSMHPRGATSRSELHRTDGPRTGHPAPPQRSRYVRNRYTRALLRRRPTGGRPTSGRPTSGRPTSGRPTSGRPTSGRPTSGRPTSGRPTSGRPTSGRWTTCRRSTVGQVQQTRPPAEPKRSAAQGRLQHQGRRAGR